MMAQALLTQEEVQESIADEIIGTIVVSVEVRVMAALQFNLILLDFFFYNIAVEIYTSKSIKVLWGFGVENYSFS